MAEIPNYEKQAEDEIKEYTPIDINSELWYRVHYIENLIPITEQKFIDGNYRSVTVLFQTIRAFAILVQRYARNEERLKPLAEKIRIATTRLLKRARQGKTMSAEVLFDLSFSLFHNYVDIMDEAQKFEKSRTRVRL